MKCGICGEEVILMPSAAHRAKHSNMPASYYTALFPNHTRCEIQKRSAEALATMCAAAAGNGAHII